MIDQYSQLLYALASLGIVGFVGWTITSIVNLKIKVNEQQSDSKDIQEMKTDLKTLTLLVYEIAGKLGIPIRRD